MDEYFQAADMKATHKSCNCAPLSDAYEKTLDCKSMEESLAKFASWEPRHSRYCYPWKQYVHLGVVLRHLGYTAAALHGCIESHIQAPNPVRALFREPCEHVAEEVVKVLRELAGTIKIHHHVSPHISDHLHEALEELDASIKSQPRLFLTSNPIQENEAFKSTEPPFRWQCKRPQVKDLFGNNMNRTTSKTVITCLEFSEALPFAAFVSLLVETVARLDVVIEEVEELGKVAQFEEFDEENIEIMEENDLNENGNESKDASKLQMLVDNTANKSTKAATSSASHRKEFHKDDIAIVVSSGNVDFNKTVKDSIGTLHPQSLVKHQAS